MAKIRNFDSFGGCIAPINVKFGTGERTCGPLPRAKFHVYRGNVSLFSTPFATVFTGKAEYLLTVGLFPFPVEMQDSD